MRLPKLSLSVLPASRATGGVGDRENEASQAARQAANGKGVTSMSTQQRLEIDAALSSNLAALRDGVFDLLAALILAVTAFFSVVHAIVRVVFAFLGLVLWTLALLITFLYLLRSWAVSRSSSSLHGRFFDGL